EENTAGIRADEVDDAASGDDREGVVPLTGLRKTAEGRQLPGMDGIGEDDPGGRVARERAARREG
ncbi:MAG: hypothetical protein GTN78_09280, partial [Gemmatimonadales bacterium]|nr:hypothetical protein [Gemmatimonadales bacterium]